MDKVDGTAYLPGSKILLQSGGTWRGKLVASSSGTADAPITYGSYGDGAKPTIYGSDVLDKSAFSPVAGTSSTYSMPASQAVGSVLGNGTFLDSAYLKDSRSTDLTTNLGYVNAHPNSYYYDPAAGRLYLNTGGAPASDGRQLTVVTRDDLVYSNSKSNLVFDNIVVRESAFDNAGYGFRIQGSTNVTVTNSEAYAAGKHNFGVIDSTGFVGDRLKAAYAMPDQGTGGASAFVSFADGNFSNQTSTWRNITSSNPNGPYDAFVMHGEGLGRTTLEKWNATDGSISLGTGAVASDLIIRNAGLSVGGSTVNRVALSGTNGSITFYGDGTVANAVVERYTRTASYAAPIIVLGDHNTLEFSTVTTGDGAVQDLLQFQTENAGSIQLLGDLLQAYQNTGILWSRGGFSPSQVNGNYNVYANAYFNPQGSPLSFQQWQQLVGDDYDSLIASAQFVDAAGGNFALADGSPGTSLVPIALLDALSQYDYAGNLRSGPFANAGAFAAPAVPEPAALAGVLPAIPLLARRRR